ncbi:hypothetical protein N5D52_04950 [Pseudomonas sp. GD03860]|uniref:hypothetical protein n=1 Tax=Pseudomonas TaxID=286 RepID=UPI0023633D03|nr:MULTISPECIES: hypothetical protein [Pseudomonas]MDD2058343.1 hypothetical protein [Pseudomonas putida]MDH0636277.1 hypothetical protein [Pseudomonas sp. GD03860]
MRAVVMQGSYGVFPTENLSLSMPAIQTCIGLYGEDANARRLVCAHFDTEKQLNHNMSKILTAIHHSGMQAGSTRIKLFGGDGRLSLLRCTPPSTYIGMRIIDALKAAGFSKIEYTRHYSGLFAQTFNYEYRNGVSVVVPVFSEESFPFLGIHSAVYQRARSRIQKRPDQYTAQDAVMDDITQYYR